MNKKFKKNSNQSKQNQGKKFSSDFVYFHIKPFKDNELWVNHWDTVLKNLSSIWDKRIQFVITGNHTDIKMYVKLPKVFEIYFKNTFFANFPTSDIIKINPEDVKNLIFMTEKPKYWIKEYLHFDEKVSMFSKEVFTKDGTYMDPMRDLFALYGSVAQNSKLDLQFTYFFKKRSGFGEKLLWIIKKLIKWKVSEEKKDEKPEDRSKEREKSKKEIYVGISYIIRTTDQYTADSIKQNIWSTFSVFSDTWVKAKAKGKFKDMNIDQAVNLFHIPTKIDFFKGLDYVVYKKLPYPTNIPTLQNTENSWITVLWKSDYRWEEIEFWIKKEDKFRHVYILWKTGTWKSTFMSNMVKSDMIAGNWLCLLDPHGDLVDTVLEHIPSHRINDVILFDVSDTDYPIWFNLLQYETEEEKVRIVSWVVATFHKLFEHSRGPRLEYILRNVLLSIVDYPNATLMHILRVLTDKEFREEVITHIKDPMVVKFRRNEYWKRNDRQREEAAAPITNKIGQFLSSSVVRNIFGQPRSKLNLREAMDQGKIILINLSKGKIWEDNASMIGSLLVTKFQIDAMSRADTAFEDRRDFYLYIDEFQNFATKSFSTILSEARKYKLSLIIANQFTQQIMEDVRHAIFGNVGTIMAFTLGHDDAQIISSQFKEMVSPNDLISLPRFHAYTKLMVDGITWDPFSMKTNPLSRPEGSIELIEKIKKQSRQRYSVEKWRLERLLTARNKKTFSAQEKVAQKARLEWMWVSEKEFEDSQTDFIQQHNYLFGEYSINSKQADAIIFDSKNHYHKVIFYSEPENLELEANKRASAGSAIEKQDNTKIQIHVNMYQHNKRINNDGKSIMIRTWSKEKILQQLEEGYKWLDYLLFVPNITQLELDNPLPDVQATFDPSKQSNNSSTNSQQFTVDDIKLNERQEWYVKLAYNYGIFVTVKWVEWLLHKNYIIAPDGVDRKEYYNTWDKIRVKAIEFKDIKWEKKVVWSQK